MADTIGKIGVGDRVRSYDSRYWRDLDRAGWYVEGKVTGFKEIEGCDRYIILVDRDVANDREIPHRVGTEVYPPVNGTPTTSGEICDSVVKLEADKPDKESIPLSNEEKGLIRAGHKVPAIVDYRERTGVSLKEAKALADEYESEEKGKPSPKPKKKRAKAYIIFWTRVANSGVIGPVEADSPEDAVKRFGFDTSYVEHKVIRVHKTAKVRTIGESKW